MKLLARTLTALAVTIGAPLLLVGACSTFNLAQRHYGWDRPFYEDDIVTRETSPDGRSEAIITLTRATTVRTTRLWLAAAGSTERKEMLVFRDVDAPMKLAWRDANTLEVKLPCEPPIFQKYAYDREDGNSLRRMIVDYAWSDPNCRLERGIL